MKRIMIAGTGSGCGKTTAVCGLMKALAGRGMKVASFKCGPDYIDPMFHSKVIGTDSYNLDSFFCSGDMLKFLLDEGSRNSDISVIEGVMGFYDGSENSSSYAVSEITDTPVIIVINSTGMSMSMGAVMKGFLTFYEKNNIIGFIFSRLPDSQIETAKKLCSDMKVKYFGRIPKNIDIIFKSRHLGLVTPDETEKIYEKISMLGKICESELLIDDIISVAEKNAPVYNIPAVPEYHANVKIAVSKDEAFCFYYSENIRLLEKLGANIVYFSPLNDKKIPEDISGIILCGGYPEIYIKKISENILMRESIKNAVQSGVPCIAECGGFMYLHENFKDENGDEFPLCGVIDGDVFMTKKIAPFGYISMTAKKDNILCKKGEILKAHEFHYSKSTASGNDFSVKKQSGNTAYESGHITENLLAGFPHFYFYSCPHTALNFIKSCERFEKNGKNQKNNQRRQ